MSRRLVKTIQATQVRSIELPAVGAELTHAETRRLAQVTERFRDMLEMRRAGLTPQEISRLEFVRWDRARRG